MPQKDKPDAQASTTPQSYAQVVPPEIAGSHSFLLQAIFDLKGSFARVEEKVDALKAQSEKLETGVDSLKSTVSMARGAMIVFGIVFTIAIALIGWMVAGDVRVTVGKTADAAATSTLPAA